MKKLYNVFLSFIICTSITAQIKVACIGNSITYGSGIDGRDSLSYPAQLQKMLGSDFIVRNFGRSGATLLKKGNLPYWSTPEYKAALAFMPEVVIIKLGTNDSKPFNWDNNKNDFENDYNDLIRVFMNLGTVKKIFLCLPIPVIEDRWEIRKAVVETEIISSIQKVAANNGLTVVDMYSPFLGKEMLIPDKIHPSAEGATVMAALLVPHLLTYRDNAKK